MRHRSHYHHASSVDITNGIFFFIDYCDDVTFTKDYKRKIAKMTLGSFASIGYQKRMLNGCFSCFQLNNKAITSTKRKIHQNSQIVKFSTKSKFWRMQTFV